MKTRSTSTLIGRACLSLAIFLFCTQVTEAQLPPGYSEWAEQGKVAIKWGGAFQTGQYQSQLQEGLRQAIKQVFGNMFLFAPIYIETDSKVLPADVGAKCGPSCYLMDTQYGKLPIALAHQAAKKRVINICGSDYDMRISINESNLSTLDFSRSNSVQSTMYSYVDEIAHEICHGLGFLCTMDDQGVWDPSPNYNFPIPFEKRICIDPKFNYVTSFVDTPRPYDRVSACEQALLYWDGPVTKAIIRNTSPTDPLALLPNLLENCKIQMNSRYWEQGVAKFTSPSHWGRSYSGKLLMAPYTLPGSKISDFRAEYAALTDIGYMIERFYPVGHDKLFVMWDVLSNLINSNKNLSGHINYICKIQNFSSEQISINKIKFSSSKLQLLNDINTFSVISPYGSLCLNLNLHPLSLGYVVFYLDYSYIELGDYINKKIKYELYLGNGDNNNNEISDFEEVRDLDLSSTEIDNPFSNVLLPNGEICSGPDCTGDDGSMGPDGKPDGQNDWDGDGYSNQYEFENGMNPIIPEDRVHHYINDGFSKSFSITNSGTSQVGFQYPEIVGTDASDFLLTGGDTRIWIPVNESNTYWVAFLPTTEGQKDAYVRIISEEAGQRKASYVHLRGTAVMEGKELKGEFQVGNIEIIELSTNNEEN